MKTKRGCTVPLSMFHWSNGKQLNILGRISEGLALLAVQDVQIVHAYTLHTYTMYIVQNPQ